MNQAEIKRRQAEELAGILTLITIYVMGRLTGDRGIVYTAAAVESCALIFALVGREVSDVLGRLLRGRRNKGQFGNIVRMRGTVMMFQAVLGLGGSVILFLCANVIAEDIFRIPYSTLILRVLSPVVLLRTLTSVLTGYFQGEGAELPRAVSSVLRQIFILGFGLLFCNIMGDYGEKVSGLLRQENYTAMYSGTGIALAVCLAEIFIFLFLTIIFRGSRRSEKKARQEGLYSVDSFWDSARALCMGRWPQLLTGCLEVLPLVLGMVFFCRSGEETTEISVYGVYAGKYLVVCGICVCVISIITLPVIGRIFLCFRKNENRFAKAVFQSGVHLCLVHGIFLSVYAAVMGARLAGVLDSENSELVAQMLQGGSAVIVLTALAAYFARFLRAAGKRYFILAAAGMADVVFAGSMALTSKAGILALVYGGLAGAFMFCLVLGVLSFRQMWVKADWAGLLIVPVGAGAAAGAVCRLVGLLPLGDLVLLPLAFLTAGAVYWGLLIVFRNFKEQELEVIPGGELIWVFCQRLQRH